MIANSAQIAWSLRKSVILNSILLLSAGCVGFFGAERSPDWEIDKPAAIAALRQGDCDKAFRYFWIHEGRGNLEAATLLADAIEQRGLTPPGLPQTKVDRAKFAAAIRLKAFGRGLRQSDDRLISSLETSLAEDRSSESVRTCLRSANSPTSVVRCTALATSTNAIPAYRAIAGRASDAIRGGKTAACSGANL